MLFEGNVLIQKTTFFFLMFIYFDKEKERERDGGGAEMGRIPSRLHSVSPDAGLSAVM